MTLKRDRALFNLFQMCNDKGRFIYEVTPIFGSQFSLEEYEYWLAFNIISSARIHEIEYEELTLDETAEQIMIKMNNMKRRKKEWERKSKLR